MRQQTYFPTTLLDFQYYVDKLPLYLQSSYGFIEHYRIWFDFLNGNPTNAFSGQIKAGEGILYLMNIFDDNYLTVLQEIATAEGETYDENKSDILDKLASLFGIARSFSITYTDSESVVHSNENITLNNKDLLILIKVQLIKNYCEGTYEQLKSHFQDLGLQMCTFYNDHHASVDLYLLSLGGTKWSYSQNIIKLFWAGKLNVQLMGIEYLGHEYYELDELLIWDRAPTTTYFGWDDGEWIV